MFDRKLKQINIQNPGMDLDGRGNEDWILDIFIVKQ